MTLRFCDICGHIDQGPRHVFIDTAETMKADRGFTPEAEHLLEKLDAYEVERIEGDATDPQFIQRHPACCAASGCPDNSCQEA